MPRTPEKMMRRPVFAANWKMHLLRADAEAFVDRLLGDRNRLGQDPKPGADGASFEVVLFPSFPLLPRVADRARNTEVFELGGQDLHPEPRGAHTGDVAAAQLRDAGATWALCGHSERRADHGESDAWIRRKLAAAFAAELQPILCIGETLEQRERGDTENVLSRQLSGAGVGEPGDDAANPLVIAYEPVWAIGTGRSATPEMAQETHAFLRRDLVRRVGDEVARSSRLLYGGSVKPDNCEQLFALPDIDGFLIGGASLDPGSFLDIIHRCGF